MTAPGGGDPRSTSADLDALPPEFAKQSISATRVILPLAAALEAVRLLTGQGRRLENWEGWVRLHDGSRAKSLTHGGSFALAREATRAADTASAAMKKAQAHWDRSPEFPGAALYFGLTFSSQVT